MVTQESQSALNPVRSVGSQMSEVIARCGDSRPSSRQLAAQLSELNLASEILTAVPSALSGGMRQRVMLAMALACDPKVLLADEPTSGLDEENQQLIAARIKAHQQHSGMALLLVTHDFSLAHRMCDHLMVLANGRCVDSVAPAAATHSPVSETQQLILASKALGQR